MGRPLGAGCGFLCKNCLRKNPVVAAPHEIALAISNYGSAFAENCAYHCMLKFRMEPGL